MTGQAPQPSPSPFPADARFAARVAGLESSVGPAFREAVLAAAEPGDRTFVPASSVRALVAACSLASVREAAVLAIPAAATIARPPISGYRVGAVGVTAGSDLILGGNLEFPHASIHHTVHAEGFVTLRARAMGLSLATLAISQARPCAHCRQVLAEMAWSDGMRLVDLRGTDVALADLYPWPFAPGDLGHAPAGTSSAGAGLAPVGRDGMPPDVAGALVRGGQRAHAPYSGEPAAVALRTVDGRVFDGAVLESVAFNPTIGPLQDSLVAMAAARVPFETIESAWVAVAGDARVDHVGPTRDLLRAVAPDARLEVTYWA